MNTKIHLLSNPRNGSTYMGNLLRTYIAPNTKYIRNQLTEPPRFNITNEPFRYEGEDGQSKYKHTTDELKFLKYGLTTIKNLDKLVVKNHITHLNTLSTFNLLDEFKSLNLYTIVLLRKNIFESSLSMAIANTKREWINYKDFTRLEIPVSVFQENLTYMINNSNELIKNKFNIYYNEIIYFEDLKFWGRHDFANTELCNISKENLKKVDMPKKIYKAPDKKDVVINYDELYDFSLEYIPSVEQDFCKFDGTVMTDIKFSYPSQY